MSKHLEEQSRKFVIRRRAVTILFTDIVGSTKLWEKKGDVHGRLLVDWHNRVLFPIVKKYGGKIIKTIGDAIMASFKNPKKAVCAAIAMQQALVRERNKRQGFQVHVRIGIHRGKAIVEHNDVFGDAVNVAARVESEAAQDEILLSQSVKDCLGEKTFKVVRKGDFKPKGKTEKITLYRCKWETHKDLASKIKSANIIPASARQKKELALYGLVTGAWLYVVYSYYLRYFLSDSQDFALFLLSPQSFFKQYPWLPYCLGILFLCIAFLLLTKSFVPRLLMGFLRGGFLAAILSTALWFGVPYTPWAEKYEVKKVMYESKNYFTRIIEPETPVFQNPDTRSTRIMTLQKGDLLVLADVKGKKHMRWNKVLVGKKKYGWVIRKRPAVLGMKETRVSFSTKFRFRRLDAISLIGAFLGFLWGLIRFKLRPV